MKNNEVIYQELHNSIKSLGYHPRPVHPYVLLDPKMLVPYDLIGGFDYNFMSVIESDPDSIEERWHILYGAYMPEINYRGQTNIIMILESIAKWISYYPFEIGIT